MRLTCPNCGAVYEVPDEVIPDHGRDVQCSNCGDTWFQAHPEHPDEGPLDDMLTPASEPEDDWEEEPEIVEPAPEPEPEPVMPEPEADAWQDPVSEPEAAADQDPLSRRPLGEDVSSVLREEAERERQARDQDRRGGLETQPDLGLSDADEAQRRTQEAKARMARLRGLDVDAMDAPDTPEPDIGSRSNLLPDIDDIDQRIKNDADQTTEDVSARDGSRNATQKDGRGGFGRGMRYAVLLAVLGTALYMGAPQLSAAVPSVAEPLAAYVQFVDGLRDMLQAQAGGLLEQIPGLGGS